MSSANPSPISTPFLFEEPTALSAQNALPLRELALQERKSDAAQKLHATQTREFTQYPIQVDLPKMGSLQSELASIPVEPGRRASETTHRDKTGQNTNQGIDRDATRRLNHGAESARDRAARIAAAVVARYANVPSYSELLERQRAAAVAQEASEQKAVELEAAAMAEIAEAEREAGRRAISSAMEAEANLAMEGSLFAPAVSGMERENSKLPIYSDERSFHSQGNFGTDQEPTGRIVLPQLPERSQQMNLQTRMHEPEPALEDLLATSWMTPPVPLPANLIEFPRELIASRRIRPKLAEGPLGSKRTVAAAQLRIFEVEQEGAGNTDFASVPVHGLLTPVDGLLTENAATFTPLTLAESFEEAKVATIGWSSIYLDTKQGGADAWVGDSWTDELRARDFRNIREHEIVELPLQPASLGRRFMACVVDFCIVSGAFLAFLFVFALSTPHLPTGKPVVAMVGAVYLALWLLYQYLFFSLSHATPGMDYARIALCTFEDENPKRRAMRRRMIAWWISVLPVGLGFAWALFDEDGLSWHDRMTRIYPRSY